GSTKGVDQHAAEGKSGNRVCCEYWQEGQCLCNAQLNRTEDQSHKGQTQRKIKRSDHSGHRHFLYSVVSHIQFSFRSVFLSQELATDCIRVYHFECASIIPHLCEDFKRVEPADHF